MSTNGQIPADQLTEVAVGVKLLSGAANAYRQLVAQGAHEHVSIRPADGVGSGYRDDSLQRLFWAAWYDHDADAIRRTQLNPSSTVAPAAPGRSSHGWGNRIDLLFNGSAFPTSVHLNLAKRFGFVQEFGSADPNHFEHDGKTAIHPPNTPVYYTVHQGDTLTDIAADHHVSLDALKHLNPQVQANPDLIHPGQRLRIK